MNIVTCFQSSAYHHEWIRSVAPNARIWGATPESIDRDLQEADILCGHVKFPVDWEVIVRRGRLQWIQSSAAGLDHCLAEPVISSDIQVTSASGIFADQVAEQTMALLYGLLRRLNLFIPARLHRHYERLATDDLHGKRIGIIGLGGNGQRIAQLLRPLRCTIRATDYFYDQDITGVDQLLPPGKLRSMFAETDVVIVTLPLTNETFHLIGERELQALPIGSYLINVGRGPTVDEQALVKALKVGALQAVGLDVAEVEPPAPDSPLWSMEQVIMTPHVGAQSATRNDDVARLFCENLRRFLHNEPLINVVDKRLGFPHPTDRYDVDPWTSRWHLSKSAFSRGD